MRAWTLLVLLGCNGSSNPEFSDEQLRGVSVQLSGYSLIHDAPASTEAGSEFSAGPLPLGFVPGWFQPLTITTDSPSWTAELVGAEEFDFVGDYPFLDGISCASFFAGVFETTLVVTDPAQPGREFRTPLRCVVDDRVRAVPLDGQVIDDAGTVTGGLANNDAGAIVLTRWEDGEDLRIQHLAVTDPDILEPGIVNGQMAVRGGGDLWLYDGGVPTPLNRPDLTVSSAWGFDGGVIVSDGSRLSRVTPLFIEAIGEDELLQSVMWASTDGMQVLTSSGTNPSFLRDLTLHDVASGTAEPFVRADGSRWYEGFGPRGLELFPDGEAFLLPTTYFGDSHLFVIDIETEATVDRLEAAVAHAATVDPGVGNNLSRYDVTPDFRYAAVVFDNIDASPGGFRMRYSAVYVIDLDDGTTWLASAGLDGQPLDFVQDGFVDGRLIEQVSISPDGNQVLFAINHRTTRETWVEVSP